MYGICTTTGARTPVIIVRHCFSYLEYLMLRYRLFYLYRDFIVTIIMAACIPPHANARLALSKLLPAITQQ